MDDWKKRLAGVKKSLLGKAPQQTTATGPAQADSAQSSPVTPKEVPLRDFCIGFDFGTSSTKATVRVLPAGPVYAVKFSEGDSEIESYLTPTRLWVSSTGALELGNSGEGDWVRELKVSLMEEPWQLVQQTKIEARPVDLAAGYMALVLRMVLDWCRTNVLPAMGEIKPRWSMNLGIPARDFDAFEIQEAFRVSAKAAWHLAWMKDPINIELTTRIADEARNPGFMPHGLQADMINVVPEVAAGVTTYARSPSRRAGPHLFVDVGATTFDSSMFLLNDLEDLKYVFLSADVDSSLGALRLHQYRASEIGCLALERFSAADPLKPIPRTASECLPADSDLEEIDSAFSERCCKGIGAVVYNAKLKAPKEISVTDADPSACVRVMLSGGGVGLPLYQDVVRISGERAAPGGGQGLLVRPFKIVPIPKPSDLQSQDLPEEAWGRLAVAYGLSYRFEDIGEFVPPSAVLRMTPQTPSGSVTDSYVSKDQM